MMAKSSSHKQPWKTIEEFPRWRRTGLGTWSLHIGLLRAHPEVGIVLDHSLEVITPCGPNVDQRDQALSRKVLIE